MTETSPPPALALALTLTLALALAAAEVVACVSVDVVLAADADDVESTDIDDEVVEALASEEADDEADESLPPLEPLFVEPTVNVQSETFSTAGFPLSSIIGVRVMVHISFMVPAALQDACQYTKVGLMDTNDARLNRVGSLDSLCISCDCLTPQMNWRGRDRGKERKEQKDKVETEGEHGANVELERALSEKVEPGSCGISMKETQVL